MLGEIDQLSSLLSKNLLYDRIYKNRTINLYRIDRFSTKKCSSANVGVMLFNTIVTVNFCASKLLCFFGFTAFLLFSRKRYFFVLLIVSLLDLRSQVSCNDISFDCETSSRRNSIHLAKPSIAAGIFYIINLDPDLQRKGPWTYALIHFIAYKLIFDKFEGFNFKHNNGFLKSQAKNIQIGHFGSQN